MTSASIENDLWQKRQHLCIVMFKHHELRVPQKLKNGFKCAVREKKKLWHTALHSMPVEAKTFMFWLAAS